MALPKFVFHHFPLCCGGCGIPCVCGICGIRAWILECSVKRLNQAGDYDLAQAGAAKAAGVRKQGVCWTIILWIGLVLRMQACAEGDLPSFLCKYWV